MAKRLLLNLFGSGCLKKVRAKTFKNYIFCIAPITKGDIKLFISIIDIPVDYSAPKRECIDRDSQRIWDQIKGNLYANGNHLSLIITDPPEEAIVKFLFIVVFNTGIVPLTFTVNPPAVPFTKNN